MNLARGLDQILEMSAEEEIAEIDEFAVVLVFNIDDAPAILSTPDLAAIDSHRLLRTNDREWNETLQ